MYKKIENIWKSKKIKKQNLLCISFLNNILINYYNNVDLIRFDLSEFAYLYNYKSELSLNSNDFISLLKNVKLDNNIFFAVDIPLSDIYINENYNIKKIIDFLNVTNADLIVFDIDYNILDLIKKLTNLNIPTIIKANKNNDIKDDDIKINYEKLIEAYHNGVLMIILENYPKNFCEQLKNSLPIPVLSNDTNYKVDGFYANFSSVFGINDNDKNKKYLNISKLLKESIKDLSIEIKNEN